MPTRLISWSQLVLEEDPDWARSYRRPWIFEFSNRRRFYARDPLYGPYSGTGLINNGGWLQLTDGDGWPTSPQGLGPGDLWNDGFIVAIVPGAVPFSGAPRVMFDGLTASQLLRTGGGNLPGLGTLIEGQLWNNGDTVSIALVDDDTIVDTLLNDSGVLTLDHTIHWPTSDVGLLPGAVWSNGLAVAIVPGVVPNPAAPPVFFGSINAAQLLAMGGGNLPLTDPGVSGQIWNNGGEGAIS